MLFTRIQIMTGTAAATLPTSSSVCIIFLIRALRYRIKKLIYAANQGIFVKRRIYRRKSSIEFLLFARHLRSFLSSCPTHFRVRGTKQKVVRSFLDMIMSVKAYLFPVFFPLVCSDMLGVLPAQDDRGCIAARNEYGFEI